MMSVASVVMASCGMGGGGGAVDLTDKEALNGSLKTMLEEKIDPQAKIISVGFTSARNETLTMDIVVVGLYETADAEKPMHYTFFPSGMGPFCREDFIGSMTWTASADQGVVLADLDLGQVADYVAKGVDIVENERNCTLTGIESYHMSIDNETGEWEHLFKLTNKIDQAKKDAGAKVKYSYPELSFRGDAAGNVEIDK